MSTASDHTDDSDPTRAPDASTGTTEAGDRTLEFEIEVAGTPDEVWQAIATGPGISSWYVPHTVDEQAGGAASARFGPGEDMEVPGRVAIWEPPTRMVFDNGTDEPGLAFEWIVEAKDGGNCTVRLVNSGFGAGEEWDAMYDGLSDGWPLFLLNLQLHRANFAGRHATAMLPGGAWAGPPERAWAELLDELGLPSEIAVGDRIDLEADEDRPALGGTVADVAVNGSNHRLALILDQPAPGTAFLAAERGFTPETAQVSVWAYLYGPERDAVAARDQERWAVWLDKRSVAG